MPIKKLTASHPQLMVPIYLKTWLFFSFLNLCESGYFLRQKNGKTQLIQIVGNDYSLLDSQRETYLEDLKKEEENYNDIETIKSPKVEEKKNKKSKTKLKPKNSSETQTKDAKTTPRPKRPSQTIPRPTIPIPTIPRPTRPRPTRPRPKRPIPKRPRPTRPRPTRPRPTRPTTSTDDCGDLIEKDVNIKDQNLQGQAGIPDPKACAAFCKTKAGCMYWTWTGKPNPLCKLKTSSSGKVHMKPFKGMKPTFSGQRPC